MTEAPLTDSLQIAPVGLFRRLTAPWGWKKRNKRLLKKLSGWNLQLRPPEWVMARLGLTMADWELLDRLAQRSDGLPGAFELRPGAPGDAGRLAALGMVRLDWPAREIYLTDAGRFLLSLTAAGSSQGSRVD